MTASVRKSDVTYLSSKRGITVDQIIENAERLIPAFRGRFRETEQLGCIPESTMADVREAGIMHLLLPTSIGGAGGSLRDFSNLIRVLARGDTTLAWAVGFLTGHNWMLARWPQTAQDDVFKESGFATMTSVNLPPGQAKPVGDGYRISGRWGYGSCVMNADWVQVMGVIEGQGDDIKLFLLPTEEIEIINTWHVMGMKGTGSNDIKIVDAFVPEHRVMTVSDWGSRWNPGSKLHPEPLYGYDMRDVNVFNFSSLAVGGAEALVELYKERLLSKQATPFAPTVGADIPAAQIRYAKAVAVLRTAKATLSVALDTAIEANATSDVNWSVDLRSQIKLDQLSVLRLAKEAMQLVMTGSGGSIFKDTDFSQHVWRDVQTASGHVSLNEDYMIAKAGENLLGRAKEADPVQFFF